jgi:hypothetical protein
MQAATMPHSPEKKKASAAPEPSLPTALSAQADMGAMAGMPWFLQTAPLQVNEPGDIYEQEADRAADMVLRQVDPAPPMRLSPTPSIQRSSCNCTVGGSGDACTACRAQRSRLLQRKREAGLGRDSGGMTAPANIVPSGGQPLPLATRAHFEERFGHDFAHVRIHTGDQAAANARSINARAFTAGPDVVFGAGTYNPHTAAGQHLLAHELAHIVQQGAQPRRVQRRVDGDIRSMSITRPWAEALTDDEMTEQVRIVRESIANHAPGTAEYQTARENLAVLEQVQNDRNLRQLAITGGTVTEQTVPRPPGLPAGGGFTLIPAPSSLKLPAELLHQIPEGQLVEAPPAMIMATMPAQGNIGALLPTADIGLGDVGMGTSVTAMTTLMASGQYLQTYGFAAAGDSALGFVAIPRLGTPGQLIPQSTSMWGHTAIYVRQGGRITMVRGFMPGSMLDTALHAGQIEAGLRGTPASIANDARLFLNTGARSVEYAVDPRLAAQAAKDLPGVGPVRPGSGLPTEYTARPAVRNLCTQSNCGLWAIEQMEQRLGGAVGPRPGTSVTALGEGGAVVPRTASQGRLLHFTQGETFAPVPGGTNPTSGGMSTGFKVLRWGGRIFFVVGVALTVAEVVLARPEERERTAVGATAGFVGGLAFGAAAGLVCGPGAPVCSVVLGLTFGIIGGFATREAAESIYDATHPRGSSRPATEADLLAFNASWAQATGGRCPNANCHMPTNQSQQPGSQFADIALPPLSALAQPGTPTGLTPGIGRNRQLSEQDVRIIMEYLANQKASTTP